MELPCGKDRGLFSSLVLSCLKVIFYNILLLYCFSAVVLTEDKLFYKVTT